MSHGSGDEIVWLDHDAALDPVRDEVLAEPRRGRRRTRPALIGLGALVVGGGVLAAVLTHPDVALTPTETPARRGPVAPSLGAVVTLDPATGSTGGSEWMLVDPSPALLAAVRTYLPGARLRSEGVAGVASGHEAQPFYRFRTATRSLTITLAATHGRPPYERNPGDSEVVAERDLGPHRVTVDLTSTDGSHLSVGDLTTVDRLSHDLRLGR